MTTAPRMTNACPPPLFWPCARASMLSPVFLGIIALLPGTGCDRVFLDFESAEGGAGSSAGAAGAPSDNVLAAAPVLTISDEFDLGRDNSPGRTCSDGGDGVSYRVRGLTGAGAVLDTEPSAGCLEVGDEVLLIHLQGSQKDSASVGRHELLRVAAVDANAVGFVAAYTGDYGPADDQGELSLDAVVSLQRVPSYSRLLVEDGAALSAQSWSGAGGGVLALRVLGDAVIDGTISMSERGFRGGPEVGEALGHGIAGESIAGLGTASTAPNLGGGGGGLGDQTRSGCVQDGNAGGGGAHLQNGADATVLDLCDGEGRGLGGLAYVQEGRLFLGSGGGSGGLDNIAYDNPPGGAGGNGGGIIWILAQSVSGTGRIESTGGDGAGDPLEVECLLGGSTTDCYDHSGPGGGGAGGAIRITSEVSEVELDVAGGRGGNGYDSSVGNGGDGSGGVID